MILAGLVLLTVGVSDLIRLTRGRSARVTLWAVAAVGVVVVGAAIDAVGWSLVAIGVAGAWTAAMPRDGSGRAGPWPLAAIAAVVTVAVAVAGARPDVRVFGAVVVLPGAGGGASVDVAVLVAGCAAILAESANIVVRATLRDEVIRAGDVAGGLKGGRLIGPLERVLVFALTATGASTLLAAILAAKGIVRFPEISRDSGEGDRAEYFLVGTLVSWTLGLAAALLLWWSTSPR